MEQYTIRILREKVIGAGLTDKPRTERIGGFEVTAKWQWNTNEIIEDERTLRERALRALLYNMLSQLESNALSRLTDPLEKIEKALGIARTKDDGSIPGPGTEQ